MKYNEEKIEQLLGFISDKGYCPNDCDLKDSSHCKGIYCIECWQQALKESD